LVNLQLRYDRELNTTELDGLVTDHPSQVHRVPGCDHGKAFWFAVVAEPWGGKNANVREFCVCARTLDDATEVAESLLQEIGRELV
jgi:hypothetical protein